jgi:hypothetical protein
MGVIKWTPDAGAAATPDELPELTHTEDQAERELREMLANALKRTNVDPKSIEWLATGHKHTRN